MYNSLFYFVIFATINVMVPLLGDGILKLIYGETHEMSTMQLIIITAITSVAVIAVFLLTKWYGASRSYVRTKPWGTMFWTILLAIGSILPLAWLEELVPEQMKQDITAGTLTNMLSTPEGYFAICMLAPLAEEIVFRGAIISAIMKWGEKRRAKQLSTDNDTPLTMRKTQCMAIVISALLFAIVHFNPAQIPHALIAGTILALLYVKTGSILPCFLFHWVNNSSAYVIANMFPHIPADAPMLTYFQGNEAAMYQALISSLFIATPAAVKLFWGKQ